MGDGHLLYGSVLIEQIDATPVAKLRDGQVSDGRKCR
jgi:hypothetical protein